MLLLNTFGCELNLESISLYYVYTTHRYSQILCIEASSPLTMLFRQGQSLPDY
jgi:hypothetical protein